uniref:Uncharacterized protein n=1 Tax=Myoviridae sp. ctkfK18 TaxID=2825165 RepID=A0A8S5VGM3_9CAUD|nr:MAG TPA: hypothetical protein [Myoviridae sp. ctkfK18]
MGYLFFFTFLHHLRIYEGIIKYLFNDYIY